MYVIERGGLAWLCTTVIEAFEVQAVKLRLRGEVKDFELFEQRLNNYERINAGVIKIYKCSIVGKCEDCDKCKECEWRN